MPAGNAKIWYYMLIALAKTVGLLDGDIIIAVDGRHIEKVGTLGSEIIMNEAKSITVDRNGQKFELQFQKVYVGLIRK